MKFGRALYMCTSW